MKRTAIKWIIAASAIIFLIGGTAWADGKGNRGPNNGGHGSGYQSAPQHNGGHGPAADYQKRPPLGKYRQHEAYRSPYRRPTRGPDYGHQKPQHDGHRAQAVLVKSTDVNRGVAMSLLTGNPLFALDAIVNHR